MLLGCLIRLEDPNAFRLLARPLIPFLRQPLDCMITLSSYPILSYPILSYPTTLLIMCVQRNGMGWDGMGHDFPSIFFFFFSYRSYFFASGAMFSLHLLLFSFAMLPSPLPALLPSLSDVLSLFLFLLFSWQRHQWHRYRSAESRHRPVSSTSR